MGRLFWLIQYLFGFVVVAVYSAIRLANFCFQWLRNWEVRILLLYTEKYTSRGKKMDVCPASFAHGEARLATSNTWQQNFTHLNHSASNNQFAVFPQIRVRMS